MYVKFNMSPYLLFVSGKNCRIGVNFIDFLFLIIAACSVILFFVFSLPSYHKQSWQMLPLAKDSLLGIFFC